MARRLILLAITVLAALAAALPLATSARATPPNVLVIVTDDQRAGETMDVMPNTRKWFHQGVDPGTRDGGTRFTEAVATTPLCCPSRSSIFTGRYVHNHHVADTFPSVLGYTEDEFIDPDPWSNTDPNSIPNPQRTTLQYYLRNAPTPYRTMIVGKYVNGWPISCNDTTSPTPPPFFTDYAVLNSGHSPACVAENGTEKWVWRYSTDYLAEKAVEFLQQAKASGQPWFLYVAPFAPHAPYVPKPTFADLPFDPLEGGSYWEQDRRSKYGFFRTTGADAFADEEEVQKTRRNQLRMLKSVDELVEKVMQELHQPRQGQPPEDEETLAVFTSDNGYMWGEHGLAAKGKPYLESIEVPFYLRWPGWAGHADGEVDDRLVANIDIAATALAAAGLRTEDYSDKPPMDGQSLLDETAKRNRILTEFWQAGGAVGDPYEPYQVYKSWASIRTPSFHYIQHYNAPSLDNQGHPIPEKDCVPLSECFKETEYYDISPTGDVLERMNLLKDGDPTNDPPIPELRQQLEDDNECSGAECPQPGEVLKVDTAITTGPDPVVTDDQNLLDDPPNAADAVFSFSSTEPNSGFICRLDNAPWDACHWPPHYNDLANGKHRLEVLAAGPQLSYMDSTPAVRVWRVDDSIPDTRITSAQPPRCADPTKPALCFPTNQDTARFEFSSPNAGSFECSLNGASFQAGCTSPKTYSANDLVEGANTFRVRAMNGVAVDGSPAEYKWRRDTQAPTTTLCPVPTPPALDPACVGQDEILHTGTATFTFSASDGTGSGVGRLECSLQSPGQPAGAFEPCQSPKTYGGLQGSDQPYTFRVKAGDVAQNTGSAVIRSFYVGSSNSLRSFSNTPDTGWPTIPSGTVRSIVPDGCGGWYVGGDFSEVRNGPNVTPANMAYQVTDLVHIKRDKTVDPTWMPPPVMPLTSAMVRSIFLSQPNPKLAGGKLYIGGTFTQIGAFARGRLAAITTPTCDGSVLGGALDLDWDPNANGNVYALAPGMANDGVTLQEVYAGGTFIRVHDDPSIRYVVKLSPSNGVPVQTWTPDPQRTGNPPWVNALAVTATNVYVGGAFDTIGGQQRTNLAEVDRGSGTASADWAAQPNNVVNSLALAQDWDPPTGGNVSDPLPTLYVGGQFDQINVVGGSPVTRRGAAEINLADNGSVTSWNPSVSPGSIAYSFVPLVSRGNVSPVFMPPLPPGYDPMKPQLPGTVSSLNPRRPGVVSVGGNFTQPRARLAETSGGSGAVTDWNPNAAAGAVFSLAHVPPVLAAAGSFTTIGGAAPGRLAFFCDSIGPQQCAPPAP